VAVTQETRLWTIGHGNRPLDEFLSLLHAAGIECLVDVRAFPASRRNPQFAREALERSLAPGGIRYLWEGKALGGRRKPAADSPHVALKNPGFRAYADHMTTGEFRDAHERLIVTARAARTAIMCAERLPWQCHRFLISDYSTAHAVPVLHLVGPGRAQEHRMNSIARIRDACLVYDGETQRPLDL